MAKLVPVESSMIQAVGYDPKERILEVASIAAKRIAMRMCLLKSTRNSWLLTRKDSICARRLLMCIPTIVCHVGDAGEERHMIPASNPRGWIEQSWLCWTTT